MIYLIIFIIIYLFYFVFVINRKNVLEKFPEGKEMKYLKYKYKIKINEKNIKKIANLVALSNSFILTILLFIISFINNFFLKLIVLFISSIVIIISVYHILGKYLQKQGGKNNV